MKSWIIITALFLSLLSVAATAQDTFSIVAIDSLTGEVGSAGASCIPGSIILSDVHPGAGVIHTQAWWHPTNQDYASMLMVQGHSPQQIIDSLIANDATSNPTVRQYGIVDLVDGGRSAGYTGVNCFDYKNHILGRGYTIAGNIIMGQEILDSMETRFLNTPGELANRLMAALQGANVVGADVRCTSFGTSSISAFIRVAKPSDTTGAYSLDLNVDNAPPGIEPIDSLQVLFNEWQGGTGLVSDDAPTWSNGFILHQNYLNPFNPTTSVEFGARSAEWVTLKIYDVSGRYVKTLVDNHLAAGNHTVQWNGTNAYGEQVASGLYLYRMTAGEFSQTRQMLLMR